MFLCAAENSSDSEESESELTDPQRSALSHFVQQQLMSPVSHVLLLLLLLLFIDVVVLSLFCIFFFVNVW